LAIKKSLISSSVFAFAAVLVVVVVDALAARVSPLHARMSSKREDEEEEEEEEEEEIFVEAFELILLLFLIDAAFFLSFNEFKVDAIGSFSSFPLFLFALFEPISPLFSSS
jgi:hypothetical protein